MATARRLPLRCRHLQAPTVGILDLLRVPAKLFEGRVILLRRRPLDGELDNGLPLPRSELVDHPALARSRRDPGVPTRGDRGEQPRSTLRHAKQSTPEFLPIDMPGRQLLLGLADLERFLARPG